MCFCTTCTLLAFIVSFQWIDLQLNKKIPTSLLLLSRALYLPEDVPTSNILQATLSALPENIVSIIC